MKKLRLLLFPDCNRNCAGCCNNDWDLDLLPMYCIEQRGENEFCVVMHERVKNMWGRERIRVWRLGRELAYGYAPLAIFETFEKAAEAAGGYIKRQAELKRGWRNVECFNF